MFNPYHSWWFNDQFVVVQSNNAPYLPSSGSQLLEFIPAGAMAQPAAGAQDIAQIGVGDKTRNNCFRFNFFGFNGGCDSHPGEAFCEFIVSGYRYDPLYGFELRVVSQTVWLPTCSGTDGCGLSYQVLDGFTNLTSILVSVLVNGQPRVWWADDIRLGWTDNSCPAAFGRQNAPSRKMKRTGSTAHWEWTSDGVVRKDADAKSRVRGWVRGVLGV